MARKTFIKASHANSVSMRQFAANMNALAASIPQSANDVKIDAASNVMTALTSTNPILTGRSRYSWRASSPTKEDGNYPGDVKGAKGIFGAFPWRTILLANLTAIKSAKPGAPIFIVNNAPYIMLLERGYSKQAARMWIKKIVSMAKSPGINITLNKRMRL